ncbi:MAG: hypothetical protein INR71_05625, partial [Terriglobus roseus]|nr:hypothetical protein [Terriglobus roseus]
MELRTKALYVGLSFLAGVLLTLGFKDVYPELGRNYRQRRRRFSTFLESKARPLRLEDHTGADAR